MNLDISAGNRAARRAQSRGRHRRPTTRQSTAAVLAASAVAAGIAFAPSASADPGQAGISDGGQAGITDGGGQAGITTPAPAPTPTPAPEPEPARTYWVAPPAQYDQVQWQQWDGPTSQGTSDYSDYSYDNDTSENTYTEPSAPLNVSELHGPVAVAPSAPIATPKKIVRWGKYYDDQPNWMSDNVAERTNNSTSVIEAQVTDGWRSIGVPTDRAQRLAGSQLALGAAGLATGATTAGTAGAVVGALGGGTIGGIIGAGLGGLVPIAPGIAPITTGVAGTAIGAGVGAAAVGIPSAAVGGLAGLATGIAVGTTYGAGDLTEPQKVEIPELDPPVITDQTQQVIDAVDTLPGGSDAVQAWTAPPTPADDARAFTLTQPGGEQVIAGLDKAAADIAASDLAPAAQVIGDAINAALQPVGVPA